MILVDGHLDIAFNRLCYGRDPRQSALETRRREGPLADEPSRGLCMVGLPELRRARVAVVFGTIFLARRADWSGSGAAEQITYTDEIDADGKARLQLDVYEALDAERGGFRRIATREDLSALLEGWKDGATGDVGIVTLMEGADPIRRPADVAEWKRNGVRIVGLSWKRTRYAGGTGAPGALTSAGRELVDALGESGVVLDLSHAAEESFYEALDRHPGRVIASHSNPRALCPGDRQLSDDMIRRLVARDGVIGIVPYNRMLEAGWPGSGAPRVPLRRVAEAMRHVAEVGGTHRAVAVGSDFDGGFGAASAPEGLETIADLPRLADSLSDAGFADAMIHDMLGGNWIRVLERSLPRAVASS